MQILDGRAAAARWQEELAQKMTQLKSRRITPGLAVVLVGNDPASVLYTSMKEKASQKLGFFTRQVILPDDAITESVILAIQELNRDPKIHGILIQLPLPEPIDAERVLESINPNKDVDCLHPLSLGRLMIGNETMVPATPKGIMRLLHDYRIETEGKEVVIVGRSAILGKPLAAMFLNRDATVTVCHSKTLNLGHITIEADIIVMDTGVPNLLKKSMVKPGAVVVDAGITKLENKVVGDVAFAEVGEVAGAITPVPGGVGPMTIVALLDSVIKLAEIKFKNSF